MLVDSLTLPVGLAADERGPGATKEVRDIVQRWRTCPSSATSLPLSEQADKMVMAWLWSVQSPPDALACLFTVQSPGVAIQLWQETRN